MVLIVLASLMMFSFSAGWAQEEAPLEPIPLPAPVAKLESLSNAMPKSTKSIDSKATNESPAIATSEEGLFEIELSLEGTAGPNLDEVDVIEVEPLRRVDEGRKQNPERFPSDVTPSYESVPFAEVPGTKVTSPAITSRAVTPSAGPGPLRFHENPAGNRHHANGPMATSEKAIGTELTLAPPRNHSATEVPYNIGPASRYDPPVRLESSAIADRPIRREAPIKARGGESVEVVYPAFTIEVYRPGRLGRRASLEVIQAAPVAYAVPVPSSQVATPSDANRRATYGRRTVIVAPTAPPNLAPPLPPPPPHFVPGQPIRNAIRRRAL